MPEENDPSANPPMPDAARVPPQQTSGVLPPSEAEDAPQKTVSFANSELTERQVLALRALIEGASLNDAAQAGGVERMTLYRWRTRNPQFIAALNAWRREHLEHARDQFLLLRDAALDAVKQGLGSKNPWMGMAVLDRMGISAAAQTAPAVPELVNGPEIQQDREELTWRELKQVVGRMPPRIHYIVPRLVELAFKIGNTWGIDMIRQLCEQEYLARQLTAEQAERLPHIIVTALDAEASLKAHSAAREGVQS